MIKRCGYGIWLVFYKEVSKESLTTSLISSLLLLSSGLTKSF